MSAKLLPEALRGVVASLAPEGALAGVEERFARAAWSAIAEPGDGDAGAVVAVLGAADALRRLIHDDLASASSDGLVGRRLRAAVDRWRPRALLTAVEGSVKAAAHSTASLLVPGDPQWPSALDDLGPHAPLCLWGRGQLGALAPSGPVAAVVGARAATAYGVQIAAELAAELSGSGVTIVSGAAYGIDGTAHRAALSTGAPTVAFLAGGVDRPYPAGHAGLLTDIVAQGAVLSEVPCGAAPTKWRFLQRNRSIAAFAGATVVVEAGARSGTLNTAGHAAALGRPLGAVPGPVTSAASAGCHRLLREYAAECITSAADVRVLLGMPQSAPGLVTAPGDTRVVDALSSRSWRSAADVARRSGLALAEVEATLGVLALDGVAEHGDRGWRFVPAARR